jgi:hypothetical protein
MTYLPTHSSGRKAIEREGPVAFVPGRSGLIGFLLAWTVPLGFCAGLVGLAVTPSFGAEVPRWLILAGGVVCVLLAMLALLWSEPGWWSRTASTGKGRQKPSPDSVAPFGA